jgi:hypothetical protein
MTTDEKPAVPTQDRTHENTEAGAGTEAAVKGGAEPAKRQAERDWQSSAKEAGE